MADEAIKEPQDALNLEEEVVFEELPQDVEDVETLKTKLEEERALRIKENEIRKQAIARAKKAEGFIQNADGTWTKPPAPPKPADTTTPVDVDERILKANGMPDELLTQLKDVAKLRGVSLIDAQSDELFKTIKANHEAAIKSKDGGLPASRGSGTVRPKKDARTPGLSEEEHQKMFEDSLKK